MGELQLHEITQTISSLEVAEIVGKRHDHVIRDIKTIIEHLGDDPKNGGNYFIEDSYKDNLNRTKPCYRLTKKGCELYGTRMTGEKGTQFAVAYIERFNEMEQQLAQPKLPTTFKEALLALVGEVEKNEQLQLENQIKDQQIAEMEPKVNYVDMVLQCTDLLITSQIAEDYGLSAIAFNKLLHEHGIQHKMNGQWLLYAKYKGEGYTKSTTHSYEKSDGATGTNIITKWTQKGRLFLYETLKTKGVLPIIERELLLNA